MPAACTLCSGMTELASLPESERIIIDGRRVAGSLWSWTVDVITDTRDGHANAETLDQAVFTAVSQIR